MQGQNTRILAPVMVRPVMKEPARFSSARLRSQKVWAWEKPQSMHAWADTSTCSPRPVRLRWVWATRAAMAA